MLKILLPFIFAVSFFVGWYLAYIFFTHKFGWYLYPRLPYQVWFRLNRPGYGSRMREVQFGKLTFYMYRRTIK